MALIDQQHGQGSGPTPLDCLLYAGHTGVSVDSDVNVIWGFNPDTGQDPLWLVMLNLRNRVAYPGVVTDDTQVFVEAKKKKLRVRTFDVILPDPAFNRFEQKLVAERRRSQFRYGFPNGDGDCNCATWLERLALPLISGSMYEFVNMTVYSKFPHRRFGECI
jgi:hypothetical protein